MNKTDKAIKTEVDAESKPIIAVPVDTKQQQMLRIGWDAAVLLAVFFLAIAAVHHELTNINLRQEIEELRKDKAALEADKALEAKLREAMLETANQVDKRISLVENNQTWMRMLIFATYSVNAEPARSVDEPTVTQAEPPKSTRTIRLPEMPNDEVDKNDIRKAIQNSLIPE